MKGYFDVPPSGAVTMEKKAISIPGSKLYGPYTPGVKAGGVVWLSGQIDVEIGDDISSQTKGALAKIDALLEAVGLTKNSICFAQVLLDDINDFQAMNEVYGDWVDSIDVSLLGLLLKRELYPLEQKLRLLFKQLIQPRMSELNAWHTLPGKAT